MKKILLSITLIVAMMVATSVKAQLYSHKMSGFGDSIHTAGTVTASLRVPDQYQAKSIFILIGRYSGTAYGKSTLQVSPDGITYTSTCLPSIAADTMHISNQATNMIEIDVSAINSPYFRVSTTAGASTQELYQKVWLIGKREE